LLADLHCQRVTEADGQLRWRQQFQQQHLSQNHADSSKVVVEGLARTGSVVTC
jgi:hypothetical protein